MCTVLIRLAARWSRRPQMLVMKIVGYPIGLKNIPVKNKVNIYFLWKYKMGFCDSLYNIIYKSIKKNINIIGSNNMDNRNKVIQCTM